MKNLFKRNLFLLQCRKNGKFLPLFILSLLLFTSSGYSQNSLIVKGRITNESGQPVQGASVIVKGLTTGVSSNNNGDFEINASPNSTLIISSVGFTEQEVAVRGNQFLNVTLNFSTTGLGEVVVVGYGTQRKEAVTGSVASISGDRLREIPARAGKWKFDNKGNTVKDEDHSADMIAATPSTIVINYILAERSREYYAEGYRWFDLVRTQKWAELAGTYSIGGSNYGNHTPIVVTSTIDPHLYLRPIPQGQLDRMEMTADEKTTYQNPGYN